MHGLYYLLNIAFASYETIFRAISGLGASFPFLVLIFPVSCLLSIIYHLARFSFAQGYYSMPNQQGQGQYEQYGAQPTYAPTTVVMMANGGSDPNAEWKVIMTGGLFGCFDDITSAILALCVPICLAGSNQAKIGENCCLSAISYCCCAGCQRSSVQNALGVADAGCMINCLIHCWCSCCALAQEARALDRWIAAGKPAPVPGAVVVAV